MQRSVLKCPCDLICRADQAGRQASIWYENASGRFKIDFPQSCRTPPHFCVIGMPDEDAWPCKSTQALAMAASHAPAEPSSTAVLSVGALTSDSPPEHTALSGTEMASRRVLGLSHINPPLQWIWTAGVRLHKLLQDVQNSDSEEAISGDIDEEPPCCAPSLPLNGGFLSKTGKPL